ncbi:MAG: type I polyketide synthase, partial [bacterium]
MSDWEAGENDVAIVGMSIRVPGAQHPSEFWRNLRDGVESIQQLDEETLLAAGESPELLRHPDYVPACGPLEDMKMFDGEFFGFSPKECAILDPQHRHFTECVWEALEDAGHPPEKFEGQVGVFAGCGMGSYFYFNVCSNRELVESVGLFLLRHTGNDKDFLSTRVSYVLDLRGPAVNVQTACSTSLVATHLACQSLLSGESDLAIAGGVTIIFPHERGYVYQDGEVLSPDGHCHAFDHRAQGTVLSSGAGVVVLRRLEDALADGDHVYAVIKGSAVNNDGGQKVGYLAPSVDGQAAAMAEAYAVADIDPATVGYVECHGTGTYMGDPIEVSALTQAFRRTTDATGFCRIASVKTNIGHLDTAAGVASLIKASLALENEAIPPTLNFEKPNPVIGFEDTPFVVNDTLHAWPRSAEPRRAAVNSLGVGGTNAH